MNDNTTDILRAIYDLLAKKENILIAIDGRCAAGKTLLAKSISEYFGADVIHMDDFFLRPEQRTAERYKSAGENIDHERFLAEVLIPLSLGKSFSYRPFDCSTMSLGEEISVEPKSVTLIEGTYSCHKALKQYYDFKIFVDCKLETRIERIRKRNGEAALKMFKERWIPLEEKYFSECRPQDDCEFILKT